jgi:hypothetical protein
MYQFEISDTFIIFNMRNEFSVAYSILGVVKKNQVILLFSVFNVLTHLERLFEKIKYSCCSTFSVDYLLIAKLKFLG